MSLEKRSNSRFQLSDEILTRDGNPTWGTMKKFDFLDRDNLESDQIHNIIIDADLAGRPDRIADKVYNRVDLDWVIRMFNRVDNPFVYPVGWPSVNELVEYPSASVVLEEV